MTATRGFPVCVGHRYIPTCMISHQRASTKTVQIRDQPTAAGFSRYRSQRFLTGTGFSRPDRARRSGLSVSWMVARKSPLIHRENGNVKVRFGRAVQVGVQRVRYAFACGVEQ